MHDPKTRPYENTMTIGELILDGVFVSFLQCTGTGLISSVQELEIHKALKEVETHLKFFIVFSDGLLATLFNNQ